MIADLEPYRAMRDSGVTWLGKVPEHWEVLPALAVYRPREIKNAGLIEKTVLSLSYGRIVVRAPEKLRGLVPESFESYQIVDPGNIIVRTTDLQNDQTSLRVGHARHRGIITAAYLCLETMPRVTSEFGYRYLNTYDLLKIIYGFGSGLRQNLNFSDIKRMPVLVPPSEEQAAIVRFLGHVDRRIRRYIRAKQNLIKLLDEQKRAIIHRAVTRGLDGTAVLKPSGIDWLGDIPAHWETRRLGSLFATQGSGTTPPGEQWYGDEVPWVMTGDLNDDEVHATKRAVTVGAVRNFSALRLYPAGALAIAMYGASIGKTGMLAIDACTNQSCCVLADPRPGVLPAYFQSVVRSAREHLRHLAFGGTQPNINADIVRGFRVPLPPLPEQNQIAQLIAAHEHAAVARSTESIRMANDLRSRLIADVVTGKMDVREMASRLPLESDDDEEIDLATAAGEDEIESDDDLAEGVEG